jgi:hypothetical protein
MSCWSGDPNAGVTTCRNGACVARAPQSCPPPTPCYLEGSVDPVTGICSNPPAPAGTICGGSASCYGGFAQPADTCDGNGFCIGGGARVVGCAPYVCGAIACLTNCATDAECIEGAHCDDGACLPDEGLGRPCDEDSDCTSGFCVDGVCCNQRCDDRCSVCSAETGGFCSPKPCSDGLSCTIDRCDPATGACIHDLRNHRCLIDGVCYKIGDRNPANACLVCTPDRSTSSWSPVAYGAPCNDGNACTTGDVCDGAGTCAGALLAPAISCPANQELTTGSGVCGAVATYTASATCAATVSCSPPSGTTLPVGSHTVTCEAINGAGRDSCQFSIIVTDDTKPTITCPGDMTVLTPGLSGTAVNYTVSASDNCAPVTVSCSPASGASFQPGPTQVLCVATDPNGLRERCSFAVTVGCLPDCAGKTCGEPDGCGSLCPGSCPDLGPCIDNVCHPTFNFCMQVISPLLTPCGDPCNLNAFCEPTGLCAGGITPVCDSPPSLCVEQEGICDVEAGGCVYAPLPAGTPCGIVTDACAPTFCTADGACEAQPVACDGECQTCYDGSCFDIDGRDRIPCNNGRGYCENGACALPCGEACADYCFEVIDTGNSPTGEFFCCPEEARLSDGSCCWVGNQPGLISADGYCTHPRRVCADGNWCRTECCGASDAGGAGVCPGPGQVCIDGAPVSAARTCTYDSECAAAGFGVCALLDVEEVNGDYAPRPNTGTCCPVGASRLVDALGSVTIYDCCSPGEYLTSTGDCCGYPEYDLDCPLCSCSFNRISRCCST